MAEPEKVALLADTHGFLDARVAAVARTCGVIVHAGDIGAVGILEALAAAGARVEAVAGNNDSPRHWPPGDRERLDALPRECSLDLPGGRLDVVHGHRLKARERHRRLRERHADAAAVVVGHSHRRLTDCDASPWILNPGAAGRDRAYGGPGCLVLTAGARDWRIATHVFEPRRRRAR